MYLFIFEINNFYQIDYENNNHVADVLDRARDSESYGWASAIHGPSQSTFGFHSHQDPRELFLE